VKSKAMKNRIVLLGHRGARGVKAVPENTLASFDLALAQGCDGFEFDVRLTADGQAVVCHDASIRGIEIARSSARQAALPFLHEVLARYRNTAFLDIELKVPGLEGITAALLREQAPALGFVISSFLPEVLRRLNDQDRALPLGLICESRSQLSLWSHLPVAYVMTHSKLVSRRLIREIKNAGRRIFVWTVNTPGAVKGFSDWGVDGIISDHPDRLAITLGRGKASASQ
jgi:glycerophosphoryl diester phosphodiesterase